ncbi:alpha/beta hydrolase family protein [Sphingobacterium athyrii]|uniref:alpha/beta hydrolase family protein n=2 Tax=Sphingobacterium TaxID=28453 RepID=UPI0028A89AB4|nr:acetylxylan esterase [Sphingobacterium athyrii]
MIDFKIGLISLGIFMGLNSNIQAQQHPVLPNVLAMPAQIDPLKAGMDDRVEQLMAALNYDAAADPQEIVQTIRNNLRVDGFEVPPLDMQLISSIEQESYTIHTLVFQSLPGVYVPASLYVPKGKGPFPAILNSHGHWPPGRRSEIVQRTAHMLASNGYVCLCIDAMGSGERGRGHQHEYHGANLGSALLDLGTPLMGMQLLENSRAIDLLCDLPEVDPERIGATGASGGGNQTMWLAAMDARVKAAVPVVSVGTFRAYIMNSNCVCELHPNGLLHFEEGQLLQAMAPKAIKIITALRDGNAAFNAQQMLKSFRIAKRAYVEQGITERLDYELFDEPHSYTEEMNRSMISWFDREFTVRRRGDHHRISDFHPLDTNALAVLKQGRKKAGILSIPAFVSREFSRVESQIATSPLDGDAYKKQLQKMILMDTADHLLHVQSLEPQQGWNRVVLENTTGQLIPLLISPPHAAANAMHVYFPSKGKQEAPLSEIDALRSKGEGVVLVDLYGLGERASMNADQIDGALPRFHTLSRSLLWTGSNMMGIWAAEIGLINDYLQQEYSSYKRLLVADRETAIAALISNVLVDTGQPLLLRQLPVSYLPDESGVLDSYNMAIHMQGILRWGDIPMLLALNKQQASLEELYHLNGKLCDQSEKQQLQDKVRGYKKQLNNEGVLLIN